MSASLQHVHVDISASGIMALVTQSVRFSGPACLAGSACLRGGTLSALLALYSQQGYGIYGEFDAPGAAHVLLYTHACHHTDSDLMLKLCRHTCIACSGQAG